MKIKTAFKVGKKNDNEWSSVYGYIPDDEHSKELLGEMFAVIRVATAVEDFAIEKFSKILVEQLQQAYFQELANYKSTLERLEESCWKMKSKMELLLSREQEISDIGIDIEMAIVVIKQNLLYAVCIGESKVIISRNGSLVDISEALVDNSKVGFIKSGSLELEETDKVCIITSKAFKTVEDLTDNFNSLNVEDYSLENEAGSSVMFIADETSNWPVAEEVIEQIEHPIEEKVQSDEDLENTPEDEPEQIDVETEEVREEEEIDLEEEEESESAIKEKFGVAKDKVKNLTKKGLSRINNIYVTKFKKGNIDGVESDDESDNTLNGDEYVKPVRTTNNKVLGRALDVKDGVFNYFRNNQTTYVHIFKKIASGIFALGYNIKEFFLYNIIGKPKNRRVINKSSVKRNRYFFFFLIIALSIFVIVNFRSSQSTRREKREIEEAQSEVNEYSRQIDEITSLVSNTQFADNSTKQELLNRLNSLDVSVKAAKNRDIDIKDQSKIESIKNEYDTLLVRTKTQTDKLLLVEAFEQPQIVNDLKATDPNSNGSDIEYSEGNLFVSDQGANIVYKIPTEIGSVAEPFISGLEQPYLLAKNVAGEIVVYDSSPSSSIGKFNPNEKESLVRFPSLSPSNIGNVEEVAIFDGNDSLYELKPNLKQLFRRDKEGPDYLSGGATFQDVSPPNWKTSDELAGAIDIAAPFEIYVLVNGEGIKRYLSGADNTISYATFRNMLEEDFEKIKTAVAFDVSTKYLVVGDNLNKRLMLFEIEDNSEKSIKFTKQFVYRGAGDYLSNIKDIKINEGDRKIYVLDDSRVLRFDI